MTFESQQYLPLDIHGNVIDTKSIAGKKIFYNCRSYRWQKIKDDSFIHNYVAILSGNPDRVTNFFNLIDEQARKADCERRRMGCVVASPDLKVRGLGYNSKPAGLEGVCATIGCIPSLTCRLTDHAEAVALREIDQSFDMEGYILFNTAVPCLNCLKKCVERNVKIVVYKETRDQDEFDRPILSAVSMSSGILFLKVIE